MSIHVALHHSTHYKYDRPIHLGPHLIRLRPAPHCRSNILSYSLRIEPKDFFINWQQDPHGNYQARVVMPNKVREFKVEVDLVTEMSVYNPFDFFVDAYGETFPFAYDAEIKKDLLPYLADTFSGPAFDAFLATIDRNPLRTVTFLVNLNARLQQYIKYVIRLEPGVQSPEETLTLKSGSCRDSAWLLVNLARRLGLAARFVSGYLIQLTPDVKSLDGPSGTEKDFTDLHAWTEIYLPGAGWIGFDPTSGLVAGEGHIPLACTPSPFSAAPISGTLDDCETEFAHEMVVNRIYESPRVTKPYTDAQWKQMDELGLAIDREMKAGDVRLTMGGEPTFISADNMDGAEWNIAAVGPEKRRLSEQLLKRLWKKYAPGGFLHYGQGKWYPGESLPRWAFTAYWRKDGQPIWLKPELLADIEKNYGFGVTEAEKFSTALGKTLGVDVSYTMPAYEDAWYYIWKERKLPSNVNPLESRLDNEEERARIAAIFERGLDVPRGYVMPLQRTWQAKAKVWVSGPWYLRQETLFLSPGDSPVGLRLPADSLPWVKAVDFPYINNPDPTVQQHPLPNRDELARQYYHRANQYLEELQNRQAKVGEFGQNKQSLSAQQPPNYKKPKQGESAGWVLRTALCVEPRHGKLFIFIPPLTTTEDYLDLVAAIEATADKLNMPVILEGENPPADSRLSNLKITPDPGVIEVNIQPTSTWPEMVDLTITLYEEARLTRLATEKFMIDGRHVGTGGGNHLVMGAATPADSPFLRRPDLLRSLIAYWHQHPSLSYLFSSLFVGPTSQAPRVDEARQDSIYELEIAFGELERSLGYGCPPWLVDRIFRNLLTDVTGNTHRAEFCIDKLYSPDSASGRLGLLELRSFEMPPHAQMSLVQQLLLRGLICWFWKEPYYPKTLPRWGNDLHDRYLLPHFQLQDINDVVEDLRRAGFAFEKEWFAPHFEFRFPRYGEFQYRDVHFELRIALEPWLVLGEEGAAGGTVRFVDSSVERLQVKCTGMQGGRYIATVGGRRIPLTSTGTVGEAVAGVRYRAWQPPSCLHPTMGVHTPLVFDLVDTWNQRAVAGCTYHVAHPGGRNYATFPINAYEAESRRLARFEPRGHTPGKLEQLPPIEHNLEFPITLDLRRPRE
ncbi:MAG: transglutaminase family protein [Verrucomicrobiota bacterium]|nr:transglutaminase family protein [Verrucomicrobiota bacterium]